MRRLLTGARRYHRRLPGTFGAVPELTDAAIAGVYVSEQGDLAARAQPDLYWECVQGALADAGLTLADVDGLIGPAPEGFGVRERLPAAAVADVIGHPLRFHAA